MHEDRTCVGIFNLHRGLLSLDRGPPVNVPIQRTRRLRHKKAAHGVSSGDDVVTVHRELHAKLCVILF